MAGRVPPSEIRVERGKFNINIKKPEAVAAGKIFSG
jgi:hypothetical protein